MKTDVLLLCLGLGLAASAAVVDRVDFGEGAGTRIARGETAAWRSGPLSAKLKVKDLKAGEHLYITVALDGSDVSHDHLLLLIDGKMMGQMHLGEIDLLDYESCWPRDYARDKADPEHMGVRTFRTYLLPDQAVVGKTEIQVDIYAVGHVWGYGQDFGQFQKEVRNDSRRIYAIWTHDTAFPRPNRSDIVCTAPDPTADCAAKVVPDVDLERLRKDLEKTVRDRLTRHDLFSHQDDAGFLAEAYHTEGFKYCRDDAIKAEIFACMDKIADLFAANPEAVVQEDSWNGLGAISKGLVRLGLAPTDEQKAKWAPALEASCNQLFTHRRFFANQCQIVDTNCHWVNRALKMCDPSRGPDLAVTTEHLKEAMGIRPCPNGYMCLSKKALSREDGFVGSYGESTIWASCDAYEATVDFANGKGDAELRKQIHRAVNARSLFRYPGVRRDGSRVMRLENVISWRNDHFPGMPDYLTSGNDLLRPWRYTQSKRMLGALKNAWEDGWFQRFAMGQGEKRMSNLERLRFLSEFAVFKKAMEETEVLPSLPMLDKRDFVWCDSEIGLVAAKCGKEILYVNAYYRARGAINNLARLHFIRPDSEFAATVWCDETFEQAKDDDGQPKFKKVWDDFQYGWQGKLYDGYREALPGDTFAWPPKNARGGMREPVGTKGGRADFYHVSWGVYEVYINDREGPQEITLPAEGYLDVNAGKRIGIRSTVAPFSAKVFRR